MPLRTEEPITRANARELDEILGKRIPVLDDGFIRVVDYMGSDAAIVQAARVSYGAGTKRVHEDRELIRYLMRNAHSSPFEMCEIKLHVRVPMDCWRQWIRHRTASVNEYSTRYSVAIDACQRTVPTAWRTQASENRQGSGDFLPHDVGTGLSDSERHLQELARSVYQQRLDAGVSREQARKDLPLSTYTEAYWKIDLHNLLHFLRLRMDPHAQSEIREYAAIIGSQIVARWCPNTWESFQDYVLSSIKLTALELRLIRALTQNEIEECRQLAYDAGWLTTDAAGKLRAHRERAEFERKASGMGLSTPWQR